MLGEIKCQQNATLTQQAWDVDCSEAGKRHRTRLRVKLGLLSSTGTYNRPICQAWDVDCSAGVQRQTTRLHVNFGLLIIVQKDKDIQQGYMSSLGC